MLLWFFGTSILAVWYVFRDPRFDYRLLCLGSILPDVFDAPFGGARAMHSITVSVGVLAFVVLASLGRRTWRKRALAIPIGMMLHLVFDGVVSKPKLFWWPFGGASFRDDPLPSVSRGAISIVLELIGAALLWRVWRTFGLRSPARRRELLRTGRMEPQC